MHQKRRHQPEANNIRQRIKLPAEWTLVPPHSRHAPVKSIKYTG